MDGILTSTITPVRVNMGVMAIHILQSFMTGASSSDGFMSYPYKTFIHIKLEIFVKSNVVKECLQVKQRKKTLIIYIWNFWYVKHLDFKIY